MALPTRRMKYSLRSRVLMMIVPGGSDVEKSTWSRANPFWGDAIRARSAAITGSEGKIADRFLRHSNERIRTSVCFTAAPVSRLPGREIYLSFKLSNALLEELHSHVVWLPNDRVGLTDPAANELLRHAIVEIANPAATSVRSFPAKGTADNPVVVHLIPATGRARDLLEGGFGIFAVTAVAVSSAPDAALIQGLFDLTFAEARVAGGVAEGLTLDQLAERHGVAVTTVRSQLKSVFAKTGLQRQSQLAALIAAQLKIPRNPQ